MCKLIFIYNADSGLFNTVSDIAHKIFSPKTYECQLCKITHGWFSMHEQWRDGIQQLGCELEYLHRDQLNAQSVPGLKSETLLAFPCVLFQDRDKQVQLLLSREQLDSIQDIDALLHTLARQLEEYRG